ncbi:glutathione transporter ATP-binding protein [Salmonella enterica subsp. enterica serovar Senftenberg str. A4-543]|uniref:Glutathione transporter ATP-binding protein n=1 Tax=Salmonella enterica subsp. enterica serovar Senftenberg str. A4-543 TaxID=913082 RepID=G5QXC1_SALSE|nr:glutathione transporter ATP-binding protein [Salmonella enterica subsp. enterica serovar Senftenberg str. A4-543]
MMAAVPVADPSRHRPRRVLLSDDIPSNIHKRGEETPAVSLQLVGPGHYVARPLPNKDIMLRGRCLRGRCRIMRSRAYNIQTGRVSGEQHDAIYYA